MNAQESAGLIEVWLTQATIGVTCRIVKADETDETYDVDSLSLRGAERELTSFLIKGGFEPVGRWVTAADDGDGDALEAFRVFRPKKDG